MSLKSRMTILTTTVAASIVVALLIIELNNLVESYVASSLETAELAGQQIKHSLIIRLQEQEQRAAAEGRKESLNELLRPIEGSFCCLKAPWPRLILWSRFPSRVKRGRS